MSGLDEQMNWEMSYRLVRSARRTVSIEVTQKQEVVVRVPQRMPRAAVESILKRHREWIKKQLAHQRSLTEKYPELSTADIEVLKQRAREYIPQRVSHYAAIMNVTPAWVKITSAKKRFGSCNAKNGLCFAWRLMRYPDAAIDYVVVHELAQIVHRNHGRNFYSLVERILPDYRERINMLR